MTPEPTPPPHPSQPGAATHPPEPQPAEPVTAMHPPEPHPAEPVTATHPSTDPWAVTPRSTTYSTPPAGFPTMADPFAALPVSGQYSAPPATAAFAAPATGPYPTPPALGPFSAPPALGPYSAPPALGPYSAPPVSGPPPGPYPPALAVTAAPFGGQQYGASSVATVQIGEIMVAPPEIRTPAGVLPLAGTQWHVADYWQTEQKVATWAIVCAVLGFFCLTIFSLLFLLIKETRHHGTVQVTVSNGPRQYVARIPVTDQGQVMHINNQVNYARSLSA